MKNAEIVIDHSLLPTITECHAARLGWTRTLFGGFSMYLSIPMWIVFHFTIATILYQWILAPLFKIKTLRWADYVIIDRYRIKGLVKIDKFNCMFCGYANGLTTMINDELDQVEAIGQIGSFVKGTIGLIIALLYLPIIALADFVMVRFTYNYLIALPLGMHTMSYEEADKILVKRNCGAQFGTIGGALFKYSRNLFLRAEMLLEQIESSWCPLHHLERRLGVHYPKHHQFFFSEDQLVQMYEVLSTKGSVSPRLPKNPAEEKTGWFNWD